MKTATDIKYLHCRPVFLLLKGVYGIQIDPWKKNSLANGCTSFDVQDNIGEKTS